MKSLLCSMTDSLVYMFCNWLALLMHVLASYHGSHDLETIEVQLCWTLCLSIPGVQKWLTMAVGTQMPIIFY